MSVFYALYIFKWQSKKQNLSLYVGTLLPLYQNALLFPLFYFLGSETSGTDVSLAFLGLLIPTSWRDFP